MQAAFPGKLRMCFQKDSRIAARIPIYGPKTRKMTGILSGNPFFVKDERDCWLMRLPRKGDMLATDGLWNGPSGTPPAF
jgi:hypothetical protein